MNRPRIKEKARRLVAMNRSRAVLALLIPIVIYMAIYMVPFGLFMATESTLYLVIAMVVVVLFMPISVGFAYFFRKFKDNPNVSYEALLRGYKDGRFPRSFGRLLQMIIMIQLWYILLVIPGIIKAFAYAMTPYILSDGDFDDTDESPITISRRMMDGHKMELFIWGLSFLGWFILGALTIHLLTILFVAPYFHQSLALFYEKVKEEYMHTRSETV